MAKMGDLKVTISGSEEFTAQIVVLIEKIDRLTALLEAVRPEAAKVLETARAKGTA